MSCFCFFIFCYQVVISTVLNFKFIFLQAGIGGIIFVPENFERKDTDQGKSDLNKINMELVDKLRSNDNAFSLGESTDGISCIR
jgi:hypothetical protein